MPLIGSENLQTRCKLQKPPGLIIFGRTANLQVKRLSKFAMNIGLAFQIIDDILDVTADSATLGKTAGKDLLVDKATYPKLLGLEESKKRADDLIAEAKQQLEPWGDKVCRPSPGLFRAVEHSEWIPFELIALGLLATVLMNRWHRSFLDGA